MLSCACLLSFGRRGNRTPAFGWGEPVRNPLPTRADQLPGERVFCFQQRPVTYSGSPPVTLPPAASGNSKVLRRAFCPGGGNRSARKSGKPWGGFKPSGVTRQSFRHASRSGKPVVLNSVDGSMRGKALFPFIGDNVSFRDSPSQEGLQVTTNERQQAIPHRLTEEMSNAILCSLAELGTQAADTALNSHPINQ